jgi:probable rRNA maturation factor
VLADDASLRALNRSYRGKDAATNVLSFPFQPAPGGCAVRHLGDVVLAAETVRKEAAEQGIPPAHHLQHLVVHGLLHLLGFDHDTDARAEAMERLEAQILVTLGIADPYAVAEGGVSVP